MTVNKMLSEHIEKFSELKKKNLQIAHTNGKLLAFLIESDKQEKS